MQEGEDILQKNEGGWEFLLSDSADDLLIILNVSLGNGIATADIKAEVHPRLVRVLAKVGIHKYSKSLVH